jgi:hypothetical protein
VELPKEVDNTEQYLGAHYYSKFFLGVASSDEVAYIYEYNYTSFGDPTNKSVSEFLHEFPKKISSSA